MRTFILQESPNNICVRTMVNVEMSATHIVAYALLVTTEAIVRLRLMNVRLLLVKMVQHATIMLEDTLVNVQMGSR